MHYFFMLILYESVTDLSHYRMWSGSESKFLIKNIFLCEAEVSKRFVILGWQLTTYVCVSNDVIL